MSQKEKFEKDLEEIVYQYQSLRKKFEIELEDALIDKDTIIAELKKDLEEKSDALIATNRIPE